MYDLVLTLILMYPNSSIGYKEIIIERYNTKEECLIMKQQVSQRLSYDSPRYPFYLDCRRTV